MLLVEEDDNKKCYFKYNSAPFYKKIKYEEDYYIIINRDIGLMNWIPMNIYASRTGERESTFF